MLISASIDQVLNVLMSLKKEPDISNSVVLNTYINCVYQGFGGQFDKSDTNIIIKKSSCNSH